MGQTLMNANVDEFLAVMPGLVPGIHVLLRV
jgi:hypothetical protein